MYKYTFYPFMYRRREFSLNWLYVKGSKVAMILCSHPQDHFVLPPDTSLSLHVNFTLQDMHVKRITKHKRERDEMVGSNPFFSLQIEPYGFKGEKNVM